MENLSAQFQPAPISARRAWFRQLLPAFWTAVICVGLAAIAVNLAINHPERLYGIRAVGLVVLFIGLLGGYRWFSWGRIYNDAAISEQQGLLSIGVQILALLVLVWRYDASFIWFSMSIPYQVIGGLSQRRWVGPLIGVMLVLIISIIPGSENRVVDTGGMITALFLLITQIGVAVFIYLLRNQRDQSRAASEKLLQAHIALTASAAQAEELAVLRERARLARSMHDDLGHALVLMNVKLEAAQLLYAHDKTRGDAELEATRALIRNTMTNLRRTLADLRAPVNDHDDLPAALKRLAQDMEDRTGIKVTCDITSPTPALPTDINETFWFVAREALTNIERHAGAGNVTLAFERSSEGWMLRIADDGAGITPTDLRRPEHYGLLGMRERLHMIGGTFSIQPGMDKGTIVEARLPAPVAKEASAS